MGADDFRVSLPLGTAKIVAKKVPDGLAVYFYAWDGRAWYGVYSSRFILHLLVC